VDLSIIVKEVAVAEQSFWVRLVVAWTESPDLPARTALSTGERMEQIDAVGRRAMTHAAAHRVGESMRVDATLTAFRALEEAEMLALRERYRQERGRYIERIARLAREG
jgi:hypothetical protein